MNEDVGTGADASGVVESAVKVLLGPVRVSVLVLIQK